VAFYLNLIYPAIDLCNYLNLNSAGDGASSSPSTAWADKLAPLGILTLIASAVALTPVSSSPACNLALHSS
jgi:hypothetical protein